MSERGAARSKKGGSKDGPSESGPEALRLSVELSESVDVVEAIREGMVDAFVVGKASGPQVYTLMSAEHPYRMIVESMQEGALVLSPDGIILYCNGSFGRMIGLPLESILSSSLFRFIDSSDAHRLGAFIALDAAEQGEMTLRREDGKAVPVHISRSRADLVSENGVCLIVTDLSERMRHEEIVASERLARSIFEQAGEAILVCDGNGMVIHASRTVERLSGEPPLWHHMDDILPLEIADADSVEVGPEQPRTLSFSALAGRTIGGLEVTHTGRDGRVTHLLLSSSPIPADDGDVIGTVFILMDITEKMQVRSVLRESERRLRTLNESLEERVGRRTAELMRANRELELRNRELQDFAFVASHHMQEPLRKIVSFGDLFLQEFGEKLPEAGRSYLHRIQHAAQRMSELIQDLLVFLRIHSHGQTFQRVDLNLIVKSLQYELGPTLSECGGVLHIADLPTLEADPHQIEELLRHLLANAIKFRREGVSPIVRVEGRVIVPETRNEGEPGEVVQIEIQDNGIGFNPKYIDRLFSPFQQLHGRNVYPGTGMGLATCRRIVERHGGTISAESTPGEGSRFIVTLPLRQATR